MFVSMKEIYTNLRISLKRKIKARSYNYYYTMAPVGFFIDKKTRVEKQHRNLFELGSFWHDSNLSNHLSQTSGIKASPKMLKQVTMKANFLNRHDVTNIYRNVTLMNNPAAEDFIEKYKISTFLNYEYMNSSFDYQELQRLHAIELQKLVTEKELSYLEGIDLVYGSTLDIPAINAFLTQYAASTTNIEFYLRRNRSLFDPGCHGCAQIYARFRFLCNDAFTLIIKNTATREANPIPVKLLDFNSMENVYQVKIFYEELAHNHSSMFRIPLQPSYLFEQILRMHS